MLRLTRVRPGDRGAVAMIVAMLFGFGVMLGLAALTIDVGNINADRRQLQNGADAVALAVAQQCATDGTCDVVTPSKLDKLQKLADANAVDNATSIRRVDQGTPVGTPAGSPAICGTLAGLPACPTGWTDSPSMSNLQECPSTPTAKYVRVYTETKNGADNRNILPYYFGAAITGIEGANQQACATVTTTQPLGSAAPIALSYCEWAKATGNDPAHPATGGRGLFPAGPVGDWPGYVAYTSVAVPPVPKWPAFAPPLPAVPTPVPTLGNEIIIGLQGTTAAQNCSTWNGHDGPGGFGYLNANSTCKAVADLNGWIQVDTGNTMPTGCDLSPYFNKVIYLPVFDCLTTSVGSAPTWQPVSGTVCTSNSANGANTWYHITGYAKFYLSGYKTGGGSTTEAGRTNPLAIPSLPCTQNDRCLSGWFLKGLVNTPPGPELAPGAPQLGAYAITLAN